MVKKFKKDTKIGNMKFIKGMLIDKRYSIGKIFVYKGDKYKIKKSWPYKTSYGLSYVYECQKYVREKNRWKGKYIFDQSMIK